MTSTSIDDFFTKKVAITESTECEATNKRTRSEGSETGNSPKRLVYDAEDETISLPDDAPAWVPVLLQAMNNVNTKIEDLALKFDSYRSEMNNEFASIKSSVEDMKTDYEQKIGELTTSVNFISAGYDGQKKINAELSDRIAELERSQDYTRQKCKSELFAQAGLIEAQEQYSRRNCALLHGVAAAEDEDTDSLVIATVKEHLAITLERHDIDRSHRLGAPRDDGKPRPIIVKFTRYNTRAAVFGAKRRFKGSNLLLTESLTRRRVEVLNESRRRFGNRNVWTMDGEIFTKQNNKTVNVKSLPAYCPP